VAVLAGAEALPQAGALLQQGVFEVLPQPLTPEAAEALLLKASRLRLLAEQNEHYSTRLCGLADEMIGRSEKIRAIFNSLDKALSAAPFLLIEGEPGTGKNLLTRQLHRRSHERQGPFIHLDCIAYPAALLERHLFGRAARETNSENRLGCLELAENGALVLNGLENLPLLAQEKLLPVLDDLAARQSKLGPKMRLFCLAHRDLKPLAQQGLFNSALLTRLETNALYLPPLRERAGDAAMIAEYFLRRFAQELGQPKVALDAAMRETIENGVWPGNIRELRNWVESAVFSGAPNRPASAPASQNASSSARLALRPQSGALPAAKPDEIVFRVGQSLQDVETLLIQKTLAAMNGNRTKAAQTLGFSVRTLYTKLLEIEYAQKNAKGAAEAGTPASGAPEAPATD